MVAIEKWNDILKRSVTLSLTPNPSPVRGEGSNQQEVSVSDRPFKVLGIQQIAIGGLDKSKLSRLWIDTLGLTLTGWSQPGPLTPPARLDYCFRPGVLSDLLGWQRRPSSANLERVIDDHGSGGEVRTGAEPPMSPKSGGSQPSTGSVAW